MNNTQNPQIDHERYCHKVLFNVKGLLAFIHVLRQKGVIIDMDKDCTHACACFDNTHDYNNFKDMIAKLPSA